MVEHRSAEEVVGDQQAVEVARHRSHQTAVAKEPAVVAAMGLAAMGAVAKELRRRRRRCEHLRPCWPKAQEHQSGLHSLRHCHIRRRCHHGSPKVQDRLRLGAVAAMEQQHQSDHVAMAQLDELRR